MLTISTDRRTRHVVAETRPDGTGGTTTRVFGVYRSRDWAERRVGQIMESRGLGVPRGFGLSRGVAPKAGKVKWTGRRWRVKRAA